MSLLKSISEVSLLIEEKRKIKSSPAKTLKLVETPYLSSIEKVNSLYLKYIAELPIPKESVAIDHSYLISTIKKTSLQISTAKKTMNYTPEKKENLLSFLKKEEMENFHSDFISAFLDTTRTGDFGRLFFKKLIEFGTDNNVEVSSSVRSQREVSLGDLVPHLKTKEIGSRRIDILAKSTSHLLVIENKINSFESDTQTEDYHDAVKLYNRDSVYTKEVKEILLSPNGMSAASSNYMSMSYRDLFEILLSLLNQFQSMPYSSHVRLYMDSLYENYYRKDLEYNRYLTDYWRNK